MDENPRPLGWESDLGQDCSGMVGHRDCRRLEDRNEVLSGAWILRAWQISGSGRVLGLLRGEL